MIRADALPHVWRLDQGDHGWITPNISINRDYGLDDPRPLPDGIDGTALVRDAPAEVGTEW
jgi:L-fuconolactonase